MRTVIGRYDNDEKIKLEYEALIRKTDAAWLVQIDGEKHFFPFSECSIYENAKAIFVPMWLAKKKGLVP